MRIKLYEHQQAALDATQDKARCAYYLDMGLGKTFVGSEKAVSFHNKILVVCQKSKIEDWITHFAQYYNLPVFNLRLKRGLEKFFQTELCAGVINYDLIKNRDEFKTLRNFTLMLDESSEIQNHRAKRTKFILRLHADNVILLSGTPCSGKYENLYSQLKLLGDSIKKKEFDEKYINFEELFLQGRNIKIVARQNPYKDEEGLRQRLIDNGAVFMRTEEVMNLPEQIFTTIKVDKHKGYRRFQKERYLDLDGVELIGDTSLTQMLCERELCSIYSDAKRSAFEDILNSTNDRLIVFYNFTEEFNKLREVCKDRAVSVVNGSMRDLTAYEDEDSSITFVQYQAGAMGLNLQKAHYIVYASPPLRSDLFEQSKKRIHRIGQNKPCHYYMLECKGTVEHDIYTTLAKRQDYTQYLFEKGGTR